MTTIRLSLVFLVLGLSILLGFWAMGGIGGAEVADASARVGAIVAIGVVASTAVLALLGRRRPPDAGNSSGSPRNGPQF